LFKLINLLQIKYWRFREIIKRYRDIIFNYFVLKKQLSKDYIEETLVIIQLFLSGIFSQNSVTNFNKADITPRILIISYYSPPYRSSLGTQRTMKFIKYLTRIGWHITLLTSELPEDEPQDEFSEPFPPIVKVVRIPSTRLYSNLNWQGKFIPDDFFHWVRPALAEVMRLTKEENYSIIYSTAPPYTNLIIGTIASAKTGIYHIPDFRDPWTRIDIAWVIKGRFLNWFNKKLEYEVLKRSKHIIMADDFEYRDDYFVDKVKLLQVPVISITNGYDEEDFQNTKLPAEMDDGMFKISYIGGFYDPETFSNVLEPLLIWADKYPEDMSKVALIYAGNSSSYFNKLEKLPFNLIDYGFLHHKEAISLRFESNVQLFSQPSYFKSHVYSGKIFEMIRTPIPILAIVKPDSAVTKLLAKTRTGFSIPQQKSEKSAEILKELFEDWKAGKRGYKADFQEVAKYSRMALSNKLDMVFKINCGISS
jgi:hypothetical protein